MSVLVFIPCFHFKIICWCKWLPSELAEMINWLNNDVTSSPSWVMFWFWERYQRSSVSFCVFFQMTHQWLGHLWFDRRWGVLSLSYMSLLVTIATVATQTTVVTKTTPTWITSYSESWLSLFARCTHQTSYLHTWYFDLLWMDFPW